MNAAGKIEMIIALNLEAFKKGLKGAETGIRDMAGRTKTALSDTATQFKANVNGAKEYNSQLQAQGGFLDTLRGKVVALVGAYLGLQTIANVKNILLEADSAAFRLESSLRAANREFNNIGDARSWGEVIGGLSDKLRIYSRTELKEASAATIDMTKRLGFTKDQMALLIERTADLSAGKTDLLGGIERVTAAMRGEAEASEYLGLTLNENYVKAWHEAHNAHGVAWKDLTDLEKAQVRFNVFLEQAGPLAGKSADSIKTLGGAYALAKKEINDALSTNENATEAMKELAKIVADNADELGNLVAILIEGASRMLRFVLEHKEAIGTIGALVIGVGTLSGLISRLSVIWGGFNTVIKSTVAVKILGWLVSVGTALNGIDLKAIGLKGTIGSLAGVFFAWEAGWQIGTFLNKFDVVKRAGISLASGLTKAWLNAKKAWYWLFGTDADIAKVEKELANAEKIYAEMFAKVGKGADSVGKKLADVAEKNKNSADKTADSHTDATEEMKKAYKSYADLVQKLNDDIAGKQQSLTEQLREMGRSGMSDLDAWKDRKNEAEEFAKAAKLAAEEAEKAFAAGNVDTGKKKMEESVDLWSKAREAAADLNTEIKNGDKVLQTKQQSLKIAKDLVEEYGRAEIETEKKFKEAIESTARALDDRTGGQLSKEMPELAKAFGDLQGQAEDLAKKSADFNDQWNQVWDDFLKSGSENIYELDTKLSQLTKDRTVKVYIEEIEKRRRGGLIGYMRGGMIQALAAGGSVVRNILSGGFLPGFGGGDRRLLLGEDGEVMINKDKVREAGTRAALAFNSGQWGVVISELLKRTRVNLSNLQGYMHGGIVGNIMQPVQALADGGEVTGGVDFIRHEHVIKRPNGEQMTLYSDEANAHKLIETLRQGLFS